MKSVFRTSVASTAACLALSAGMIVPPQTAHAGNDFVKGAIVGGIGAILLNESRKNSGKSTSRKTTSKPKAKAPSGPRVTIATFPTTRDQVRDFQTRLNTLGFDAGVPDGLYGRNTRTAVSNFQASIGAAPTGKLNESDAAQLVQRTNQPLVGTAGAYALAPSAPNPFPTAPGAQTTGVTPSPAFPALGGAPQQAGTAAAPAFPTFGGTPQQPSAPATTFPQLGTQTAGQGGAAPSPAPTFPAITATAGTTGAPQSAFPAVPAAPGVAAAAGATALTVAAIAPPVSAAEAAAPAVSRFSILDVSTGMDLNAAKQQLAFEGLGACEETETISHCSSDSAAVKDLVALNTVTLTDGSTQIGALSRHLTFANPMPQAQLQQLMADKYSELLSAPSHMIGSADCMGVADLTTAGRAELTTRTMSGDTASLAALANTCEYFARIVFGPDANAPMVNELSIFIFDGSVFAQSAAAAAQPAKIKF